MARTWAALTELETSRLGVVLEPGGFCEAALSGAKGVCELHLMVHPNFGVAPPKTNYRREQQELDH